MIARVPCSAVRDCAWVILCGVGLDIHGTGVVPGGVALGRVSIGLAFVALGGGAEGDVLSYGAFAVEHCEAGGTKRLLRHLTYEGDDYRRSLFTLAALRAGEPMWYLAHSEGGVGGYDFGTGRFGCGCGWDAMDDEAGPSLADPGRRDGKFVVCIYEDA